MCFTQIACCIRLERIHYRFRLTGCRHNTVHVIGSGLDCVQLIVAIDANFANRFFYHGTLPFIQRYRRMPKLCFLCSFQF